MATPVYVHGKTGTVSINGTTYNVVSFTYSSTVDQADITNTGGGGWYQSLPGVTKATGSLTFVYDTANQPVLAPTDMRPGTSMALILKPEGSKAYSFNAWSLGFDWSSGPADAVRCSCNYTSDGAVTTPAS